MSRPLRLLHCADLHLDSPVRGLGAPDREPGRRAEASFRTFERLLAAAREHRVDCVLVAGDVFDAATRSLRARLRFREGLAALAAEGIPSFVAFGNHDHAGLWSSLGEWPAGVTVFPPDAPASVALEVEGVGPVHVHGVSHGGPAVTENLAARLPRARGPGLHIGVLHANVGGATGHADYAPCGLGDLVDTGYHYLALGHVHGFQVLREEGPCVVYPGCVQGRHPGESGPRGAALVGLTPDAPPEVRLLDLAALRFEDREVDLEGVEDLAAAEEALRGAVAEACAAAPRALALRLTLVGETPLDPELRAVGAAEELLEVLRDEAGDALLYPLRLRTRPRFDRRALVEEGGFLGAVLEEAAALRDDPAALREELSALYADPRFRELLPDLEDAELGERLERAVSLLLGRLTRESA